MLGLGGEKPREKVANLIRAVEELKATCGVPVSNGCQELLFEMVV